MTISHCLSTQEEVQFFTFDIGCAIGLSLWLVDMGQRCAPYSLDILWIVESFTMELPQLTFNMLFQFQVYLMWPIYWQEKCLVNYCAIFSPMGSDSLNSLGRVSNPSSQGGVELGMTIFHITQQLSKSYNFLHFPLSYDFDKSHNCAYHIV